MGLVVEEKISSWALSRAFSVLASCWSLNWRADSCSGSIHLEEARWDEERVWLMRRGWLFSKRAEDDQRLEGGMEGAGEIWRDLDLIDFVEEWALFVFEEWCLLGSISRGMVRFCGKEVGRLEEGVDSKGIDLGVEQFDWLNRLVVDKSFVVIGWQVGRVGTGSSRE